MRDARRPGNRCPQPAAITGEPASETEDCLYLNVTTPRSASPHARKPVLVWVHGGGLANGAGSDYDARRLTVGGDIVVVTANYRLGALGFLGLRALPGSANLGLQDQQAALRWVRRNVARFGGEPARVTLAGESAGAQSSCAQLASSAAAGLFDQVILQSNPCVKPGLDNSRRRHWSTCRCGWHRTQRTTTPWAWPARSGARTPTRRPPRSRAACEACR